MSTNPPVDFTELAELLVRAAARRNYPVVGEVLGYLDPDRVDIFVYIHGANAHMSIIGAYRNLYLPSAPRAIQPEPGIA